MFNVEPYLPPLLESLASQELRDIEFFLIDDGSTDRTSQFAKEQVAQDERFSLIKQENQGLSAARNTGIRKASGQYLAFADGDDVVPPSAYRALVDSLEESGSDIASGAARRLTSKGTSLYRADYTETFATPRRRTHITRDEVLIADRMVWNKVFRRSFWDAQGLEFRLPQYEDGPVTIRAHITASAVDVISDIVYYWRIRETGEPSITQRQYEAQNIGRRMKMMLDISEIIHALAPSLAANYARDMLLGDIDVAMTASTHNSTEDFAHVADLIRQYVSTIDPSILDELDEEYRRRVFMLVGGQAAELRALLIAENEAAGNEAAGNEAARNARAGNH
jgi:CDP-glycerol glycerophosphotransferase